MNKHPHEGPHCVEDTLRFMKDRKQNRFLVDMNEHPHEGPHCVENALRFLNLDEHPHEGPHCVEDTLRFRAASLLGRHE